jgi:hypothetical protein
MIPSLLDTSTTSVKNSSESEVKIYPNPANNYVILEGLPMKSETKITLKNMLGQQLGADRIITGESKVRIDMQNLPDGIYLVSLVSGGQNQVIRIIKQNELH